MIDLDDAVCAHCNSTGWTSPGVRCGDRCPTSEELVAWAAAGKITGDVLSPVVAVVDNRTTKREVIGTYNGRQVIRTTRLCDGVSWDYVECPTCKCLNIGDYCGVCHNKVAVVRATMTVVFPAPTFGAFISG